MKEFSKRCEVCWKYREAHMYPFKIGGKYKRLCRECWEAQIADDDKRPIS